MAFDDERSDIQMAVRSLDESNRLFAVEVDMENRSPEEIARDAVMQINALFDRLIKEQQKKMIKTLYEIFQHWSAKGSVYLLSDLHLNDDDCLLMDPDWIPPEEQIGIINNKVTRGDTFICLGDVGSPEFAAQIKAGQGRA